MQNITEELKQELDDVCTAIKVLQVRRRLLEPGVVDGILKDRAHIARYVEHVDNLTQNFAFWNMFSVTRLLASSVVFMVTFTIMYGVCSPLLQYAVPDSGNSQFHFALRTFVQCFIQSFLHILLIEGGVAYINTAYGTLQCTPFNALDRYRWLIRAFLEFGGLLFALLVPLNIVLFLVAWLHPPQNTLGSNLETTCIAFLVGGASVGAFSYLCQLGLISLFTGTYFNTKYTLLPHMRERTFSKIVIAALSNYLKTTLFLGCPARTFRLIGIRMLSCMMGSLASAVFYRSGVLSAAVALVSTNSVFAVSLVASHAVLHYELVEASATLQRLNPIVTGFEIEG